jgi:hypothetical protein
VCESEPEAPRHPRCRHSTGPSRSTPGSLPRTSTIELAMQLNRPDLARRYARAYRARAATDANAPTMRLVALVLDSGGVRAPAVARAVQSATAIMLWRAGVADFKWWADSAETAVALLRELVTDSTTSPALGPCRPTPLCGGSASRPRWPSAATCTRRRKRTAVCSPTRVRHRSVHRRTRSSIWHCWA